MVNVAGNLIDAPGTPEGAWHAWPGLGQLPPLYAAGWASAVVVAAHEHDVTARLRELAWGFDALLAPWDRDAHPDHEVAGRAARAVRAGKGTLWYPVWMWHWARPGDPRVPWHAAVRVSLPRPVAARKRRAIGCFASQLQDRSGTQGPVLPAGIVAHFARDVEVFFR